MANDTHRLTDAERANLVAYLDGELNDAESRALGTKLTQSVTARREIDSLQKTWELLDFLPKPEPSEAFTTRTLTEIRLIDSRGGRLASVATQARSLASRAAVLAVVTALALVLSYVATRWGWPDPTARLASDLPIAEHLDEYRRAGSFEFLKLLDESPALNEEASE